MIYKVFLDVNVLLDFFLKRKNFKIAEQILLLAKKRVVKLYVSSSIIQTVSYYLQRNFDTRSCKTLLLELLKLVNVIEASQQMIYNALNSAMADFEDAIHYCTATSHKLDYLVTSDVDFQKFSSNELEVVSAKYFLEDC